jgi:hypothetical protein
MKPFLLTLCLFTFLPLAPAQDGGLLAPGQTRREDKTTEADETGTTATYITTRSQSIINKAAEKIMSAGKGTQVALVCPYVLSKKLVDALVSARNGGANVTILNMRNPPITDYKGLLYMRRNQLPVFVEDVPEATETYIILAGAVNCVMFLSIPPDPQTEAGSLASILIVEGNTALRNVMINDFTERLANAVQVSPSSKTAEP